MALATPQNPTNEEILQRRIREITDTENENITTIRTTGTADRRALEERVWRSKVLEDADASVCHIRMERMIEGAREEIYCETTIPGPIRKLPAEMFSTIFRYHVDDDRSPWILVKVSKAWMHTAMRTPHLWCRLMVVSRRRTIAGKTQFIFNGEPHYSVGNMQLCDDTTQLQAALNRSGTVLPLSIGVEDRIWEGNSGMIASVLIQILSSPISERIQDLTLSLPIIRNARDGIDVPIGPFPLLRSITLPANLAPWTHRFLESVSSTSGSLVLVALTGVVSQELATHSFWHRVKRLTLYHHGQNTNGLNLIAPQMRALEHVEGLPYSWPTEDTSPVVWENMPQLSHSCDPRYLGRLQLPRLETLTFRENGRGDLHPLSEYGQILYPALVTLDVEIMSSLWPQHMAGAFPALLNLALKCGQDDEVIVDILNAVPTVRNLKIIGPPSKTFGFQMLQDLQSDEEPLVCPNLEWLTLGDSRSRVRTLKGNNGPLCRSLVQFRREIGKPLRAFTVYWHYRKEVKDYAAIA